MPQATTGINIKYKYRKHAQQHIQIRGKKSRKQDPECVAGRYYTERGIRALSPADIPGGYPHQRRTPVNEAVII
jgi:hypothetical protein